MSKQSIRPQGAEGISHPRKLQNLSHSVKQNRLTRATPVQGDGAGAGTNTASFPSRRCQAGDLVMIVRSRAPERVGRIGVIVCSTTSAAAAALVLPNELAEVQRRDWIVDFQGAPDVTCRDGEIIVTHLLACRDATLKPLRANQAEIECEAALALGGAA